VLAKDELDTIALHEIADTAAFQDSDVHNTSTALSSRAMKPNPVGVKNFTVPVIIDSAQLQKF
jgi:hypothetical protein